MKNIIKISLFSVLVLGLLSMFSCTKDFEDMNKNPNVPGIDKAAPDMLLTNAIESMTDRVHEIFLGHEMGSCWVQHMAKCQYTDEDRYIYRPSVVNNSWTSFYAASGEDVATIYAIGNSNYKGVALVLQCYISSVLTDLFGPIPYTQAWQGATGNILPAYDDQKTVYLDMIAKLYRADTLLTPGGPAINGDILFDNDILKWKKFANSLRLRLLLRISDVETEFAKTEMAYMLNNPDVFPIFQNNSDNAALNYLGSAPNNHPINENRKSRDDHRVSKNMIDLLVNTYNDYRVMVYAKPDALGTFDGMPNGLTSALAAAYNGNGLANTSKIGDFFTQPNTPGQLMSFSELQFLLAEAAAKNYIDGGMAKAKDYYIAGITASFDQYRDTLQTIFDHSYNAGGSYGGLTIDSAYTVDLEIAKHTTDPGSAAFWDETKALQLIAEQKYIAMFDQGLQAWFEWRRTGYPRLTPAANGANEGKIPVRVPYPSDEYATNPGNLGAGVEKLQGKDDLNTRVWWDKFDNPLPLY